MSNATEFRPTAVINTLSGSRLDIIRRLGIPATYPERSTLNESYDILAGYRPEDPYKYPSMRYLVLGNAGAVSMKVGPVEMMTPIAHSPTDVAPWGPMPIVVRALDDDLPESVRSMFALRKIQTYHNQRYITYSAMLIDLSGCKAVDYLTTVTDGVKDVKQYNYTDSDLHPERPVLPDYNYDAVDQVLTADGKYVNASAVTLITLDSFVLGEIMNASRIIYGTPLAAVISEWCLCSGIATKAKGDSFEGTSEITYDEVACCQVNMFISQYGNAIDHSERMDLTVNVAQTTPYPLYESMPDQMQRLLNGVRR